MGLTILFTHLKIILLQCFQFQQQYIQFKWTHKISIDMQKEDFIQFWWIFNMFIRQVHRF